MNERDKLVESNLALVHSCCKRFKNRGIDYEELFSAGCFGLVKAAERFDPTLGYKLSTYAVPVILGEIKRLFRDGGSVKVSRSIKELNLKVKQESESFYDRFGREPTVNELSALLELPVEKISEALNCSKLPLSLSGESEEDRVPEIPCEDIAHKLTDKLALEDALARLCADDRKIIELRYYLCLTQCETARRLNMTQVQISRREKKILGFLRTKLG